MNRDDIVHETYEWVNTPFQHFQCCKGIGVDCAHLVIGIGKSVGLLPRNFVVPFYTAQWQLSFPTLLLDTLNNSGFRRKPIEEALPGDIYILRFRSIPQHTAIIVNDGCVVHARISQTLRKVVVSRFIHERILEACYTYPGIEG
jgi:cell wall-associated NlpC family hydrolase